MNMTKQMKQKTSVAMYSSVLYLVHDVTAEGICNGSRTGSEERLQNKPDMVHHTIPV